MRRFLLSLAITFILTVMAAVPVFAQDHTYPIQVKMAGNRYQRIDFTEFSVYRVSVPENLEYIELWSQDGDQSRVSLLDFPSAFEVNTHAVEAGTGIVCDGIIYLLDTNTLGQCVHERGAATCFDPDSGSLAAASCETGCAGSWESGTCIPVPIPQG